MAVKKADNGTWMYDIRHPITKKRRRLKGFPTKAAAERAKAVITEQWFNEKHGTFVDRAAKGVRLILVDELLTEARLLREEYVDYFTHRLRSSAAVAERVSKLLSPTLLIQDFTTVHIQKLIEAQIKAGVTPRSVRTYMSQLQFVLARIKKRNLVLVSWNIPAINVEGISRKEKLRRIWEPSELERLLDVLGNPPEKVSKENWRDAYDFLSIGYLTGMRRTEILLLEWSKILWQWNMMSVRTLKQKGEVYRDIPLSIDLLNLLQCRKDYIERIFGASEPLVFPHYRSSPGAHWIYNTIKAAATLAGVRYGQKGFGIVPHGLRHTAATQMLVDGTDMSTAAEILGNTVETMMKNYAHTTMASKRAAVSRMRLPTTQSERKAA